MNDRILELYCSVDEPQHLAASTVSFLTLPPNLQVIGEDKDNSAPISVMSIITKYTLHMLSLSLKGRVV